MRIVICDSGLGNLRSVERALLAAGSLFGGHSGAQGRAAGGAMLDVVMSSDADVIRRADKIVVPGQGAFGDCTRALAGGLGAAIRERIAAGTPYLGICLGLQVLFDSSEEAPGCAGLGVFEGEVVRLRGGLDPSTNAPLKVPHVGWNTLQRGPAEGILPAAETYFYFVHSYVVAPRDRRIIAATTEYGESFVSAVAKDNVFACQFHPEKSQRAGLALLARFLEA